MLRFKVLDIPVGVHFSFLFVALLAAGVYTGSELVAFTLAIFLGILVHEAGHAFTARAFGSEQISITLFALGGVTMYSNDPPLSAGRRFVISAAGSAAGIAVGAPLFALWHADVFDGLSRLARVGIWSFIIAALFWGLLNWIPIRPLDGGQMLTAALEIVIPRHAETVARIVTVVVGTAAIVVALVFELYFAALFVGFLVFMGARDGRRPTVAPKPRTPEPATDREGGTDDEASRDEPPPPEFPI